MVSNSTLQDQNVLYLYVAVPRIDLETIWFIVDAAEVTKYTTMPHVDVAGEGCQLR
jgi:hypothetical protein